MALCSLDDVNAWLGFTTGDDTARDTQIQKLIDSTSLQLKNYCDTYLEETIVENEKYIGSGNTNSILLNNAHVSSVQLVEFLDCSGNVETTAYDSLNTIDEYNLQLQKEEGTIKLNTYIPTISGFDYLTEQRKNANKFPNINVSYTCGFNPVPADIEEVCASIVARKYTQKFKTKGNLTVKSKAIQDLKLTYETSEIVNKKLFATQDEIETLDHYKRWF